MDRIRIVDLEVWARVGVPDLERSRAQRLLLSVELELDVSGAAAADDLAQTVDYGAVSRRLVAWSGEVSWRLIEAMAVGVGDLLKEEFGVNRVKVEVKKFVVPQARYVSVEVER